MQKQTADHLGIVDALAAGLNLAGRRLWLMIIPVAVDLALWLGPHLSINRLVQQLLVAWEALLQATYTPAQLAILGDALNAFREVASQAAQHLNIATGLTAGWLAPTSALLSAQANRLLLVSDSVLAPIGLSLQLSGAAPSAPLPRTLEINNLALVIGVGVGLWLIAQVLATLYLRWAAASLNGVVVQPGEDKKQSKQPRIQIAPAPFWPLFVRFAGLSLLLALLLGALRLPLATATAMTLMTGSTGAAFLFALSGGLTLWLTFSLLISMFFASEAMLLDGQGFLAGMWRSMILVRLNGLRTLAFVLLVNLLMLGARAVWGLIGRTPLGVVAAILGNGYLVTAMVLATMIYYDDLRRRVQATPAGE
ncbi:MAG: hypothetical protein ACUVS6_04130 [Anaerolineae bacterium]